VLSSKFEKALKSQGFNLIAGVDEVGRGPLAGPILAAAVILPDDFKLKGLNDSKMLSAKQREELFPQIKKQALAIGLARISHRLIDQINIHQANLLAMRLAVENLQIQPDYLLVDGPRHKINLEIPQTAIKAGDRKSISIAAASVIAKVVRDRLMVKYHEKYPEYGFDQHKGYGTRRHFQCLSAHGPCPIHRKTFLHLVAD